MPRRPQPQQSDSSEEEEYVPSTQVKLQLPPQDLKLLAGLVCNFLIVCEHKKVPAKRTDIRKLVLKERARHFSDVMKEAITVMERVFGYQVKELADKSFILVNGLGVSSGQGTRGSANQAARIGLITAVLVAIFMTDTQKMNEDTLVDYLKTLGVDANSKEASPVLGNVHKLIYQDLPREKYLEVTLDKNADPPTKEFRWGERAHLELSKKDILELACKIYGDNMRPQVWTTQWKEVQKEAEE